MSIALVRIDDRLVHGQVVEGWIPYLKVDQVAVVCDQAAGDPMQQALMRLALPEEIRLTVLEASKAGDYIADAASRPGRVLVLAPGPQEVLALLEGGANIQVVNVGGLHYVAGRVQLGRVIYLSEQDRQALAAIASRGVRLEGQAVPSDAKTDIEELLRDVKLG